MEIIDKKPFEQVTKDFDEIVKRYDFLSDIERSKTEFYYNESLLRATCLISKADAKGIITYVNDKFCEISGYTEEELVGQDHKILNSGAHNKKFWQKMYETCLKDRKIWQDTITNAKKNGELYHVQSWIQATFDHEDKFTGYISVRQDVTELINKQLELDKKNTYLEHAAKILRHDMHSGINTYIPRGISSLERRLSPKLIKELKLEIPFKMLKEGLKHTQKVYDIKVYTQAIARKISPITIGDAFFNKDQYDNAYDQYHLIYSVFLSTSLTLVMVSSSSLCMDTSIELRMSSLISSNILCDEE